MPACIARIPVHRPSGAGGVRTSHQPTTAAACTAQQPWCARARRRHTLGQSSSRRAAAAQPAQPALGLFVRVCFVCVCVCACVVVCAGTQPAMYRLCLRGGRAALAPLTESGVMKWGCMPVCLPHTKAEECKKPVRWLAGLANRSALHANRKPHVVTSTLCRRRERPANDLSHMAFPAAPGQPKVSPHVAHAGFSRQPAAQQESTIASPLLPLQLLLRPRSAQHTGVRARQQLRHTHMHHQTRLGAQAAACAVRLQRHARPTVHPAQAAACWRAIESCARPAPAASLNNPPQVPSARPCRHPLLAAPALLAACAHRPAARRLTWPWLAAGRCQPPSRGRAHTAPESPGSAARRGRWGGDCTGSRAGQQQGWAQPVR